jgi:hypothetical protein
LRVHVFRARRSEPRARKVGSWDHSLVPGDGDIVPDARALPQARAAKTRRPLHSVAALVAELQGPGTESRSPGTQLQNPPTMLWAPLLRVWVPGLRDRAPGL